MAGIQRSSGSTGCRKAGRRWQRCQLYKGEGCSQNKMSCATHGVYKVSPERQQWQAAGPAHVTPPRRARTPSLTTAAPKTSHAKRFFANVQQHTKRNASNEKRRTPIPSQHAMSVMLRNAKGTTKRQQRINQSAAMRRFKNERSPKQNHHARPKRHERASSNHCRHRPSPPSFSLSSLKMQRKMESRGINQREEGWWWHVSCHEWGSGEEMRIYGYEHIFLRYMKDRTLLRVFLFLPSYSEAGSSSCSMLNRISQEASHCPVQVCILECAFLEEERELVSFLLHREPPKVFDGGRGRKVPRHMWRWQEVVVHAWLSQAGREG